MVLLSVIVESPIAKYLCWLARYESTELKLIMTESRFENIGFVSMALDSLISHSQQPVVHRCTIMLSTIPAAGPVRVHEACNKYSNHSGQKRMST